MSIVIAVATMNKVIIKCDGRERDAVDHHIISEEFQKIRIINAHHVIGYTGDVQFIYHSLIQFFRSLETIGFTRDKLTPRFFSESLSMAFARDIEHINQNNIKANFVSAGVENNKIVLYSFCTGTNGNVEYLSPSPQKPVTFCTLTSSKAAKAISLETFCKLDFSENKLNDYIKYIASIDDSVNTNIFTAVSNL